MDNLLGIIADDLTGANDSGVQLTERGIPTSVLFDIPEKTTNFTSGLVIDTSSRSLSQQDAAGPEASRRPGNRRRGPWRPGRC